jgi:hypothetical protein
VGNYQEAILFLETMFPAILDLNPTLGVRHFMIPRGGCINVGCRENKKGYLVEDAGSSRDCLGGAGTIQTTSEVASQECYRRKPLTHIVVHNNVYIRLTML